MYLTEKTNTNANEKKERTRLSRRRSTVTPSLLDSIPSALAHITNDLTYVYVNEVYFDWFVTNPGAIIAMSVSDVLGKDLYDHEKAPMLKALNGETVTSEFSVDDKQTRKFIRARYTPNLNEKGRVDGFFAILTDITGEKQIDKRVEMALHESEQRYHDFVHGLPAAVYTTDHEGYIMTYNEAAAELWGRRPEVGKDMWCGSWKIYEADGTTLVPRDKCPMALALQARHKIASTVPLIAESPEGNRKYFIPYSEPMFDANRNVIGGFNMLVDVTASRLAEYEKARLGTIEQSSDDAIIGKTLDGIVTSWNNGAERLFGYREDEMIGQSITRIFPDDRLGEEPVILKKLRNGEKIDHLETKRITKDGQLVDISLTVSPVKDSQGNIIGASKIARDITGKKRVEETNAKLAAIVQSSDDAIIGKTLDGIITSWNPAAQRLFGYTEEEIVGQSIARIIPFDRLDEEPRILSRLRRGEKVEHFETKRVTKTGKRLDISLTISPIKDSSGRIVGASKIARDISLQKEVEKLIHENEEKFRMAVETTNLGTWEYNVDDSTLICSSETRRICGLRNELSKRLRNVLSHIHDEDKSYFLKEIRASLNPSSQGRFDLKVRICRFDNAGIRWVRVQGKLFFDRNKKPERFIGTLLDVTKDKATEQQVRLRTRELNEQNALLKKQNELIKKIIDSSLDLIAVYDTDTRIIMINRSALESLGSKEEEVVGKKLLDAFPQFANTNSNTDLLKALRGETIHNNNYQSSFTGRHYENFLLPLCNDEQKIYAVLAIAHDNTILISKNRQLQEAQQIAHLGNWEWNMGTNEVLWSDEMYHIYGYGEERFPVTLEKATERMLPEGFSKLREGMKTHVEEALGIYKKTGQLVHDNRPVEYLIQLPDGQQKFLKGIGKIILSPAGTLSNIIGTVQDITEQKEAEEKIVRQLEELKKLNEADKLKSDFIKMASHELKTPVTSIKGYVQLLLSALTDNDEEKKLPPLLVRSSLVSIDKQVARLTRLMSELLDLSKIESGMLQLNREVFNLNELVIESVQDILYTHSKHHVNVFHDFACNIYGDKDRIGQVLINILSNAIKYSPAADKVEVWIERDMNGASVSVKDFGIGIDKKYHDKIFERFYRAGEKHEQTFPGFGIGLFIAREIVERHNGKIYLSSEKGKGSIFSFILPIEKKNNDEETRKDTCTGR